VTTFTYTTPVCANVSSTLSPNTSVAGFTPNGTYTVTSGTGLVINASTGIIDLVNSAPGTYVINYAVLDNPAACTLAGNTSFTLVINALPTITVNSPKACAGSLATVIATPSPVGTYSYVWTVPGGVSNPGNVASFTTSVAGVYSVIITNITTGCSSASASGTVTINALPTVTVNSPTVCQGTNAVVTATPSPSGTYSYVWTVPAGVTNPGNVDHFTATVSGNYSVAITNIATGCTSVSATSIVTINANPSVSVSGDTVCQGALATISTTASPSGTYTYVWNVPTGANNPGNVSTFGTATPGTYSVVITNISTGCSSTSQSGVATIAPAFDFVITDGCVNNNFILEVVPNDNSFDVNTANFIWQYGGNTIGTNSSTFDVTSYLNSTTAVELLPLTFSVIVQSNGCQQNNAIVLDRIYCDIQKGISPNNDGKNEYFDLTQMNVQLLSIYNRYGTKVYSKAEYSNEWVGQSDAGNELPDGTYYYVIEFKNNQASKTGWIYINRENK
jgi:gliding motility-associated-like protein